MKIKDLKLILDKYDEETEVCSGIISERGITHLELKIKESHPIGDRDSEEELLLVLGCENLF